MPSCQLVHPYHQGSLSTYQTDVHLCWVHLNHAPVAAIGSGMQWSWPNSYSSTVFHCSFTFLKASCHWLYILTSFMPLTSWAWALNQFNQSYSVLIILLTCIKTWFPTIPYRQIFMLLDYQMTNCKHVRHLKTIVIMSDERLPINLWSKFLSYKLITPTLNLKCWLPNLISNFELRI